jgi:glycosyltransferase involved in cell wall biosynthesis
MGEFLALGIPLLTTDCPGGFRDVMGAAGVVVPPDDSAALAAAIARLAEDSALRQKVAGGGQRALRGTLPRWWLVRSWTWSRRSSITPGRPAVTAERTP